MRKDKLLEKGNEPTSQEQGFRHHESSHFYHAAHKLWYELKIIISIKRQTYLLSGFLLYHFWRGERAVAAEAGGGTGRGTMSPRVFDVPIVLYKPLAPLILQC